MKSAQFRGSAGKYRGSHLTGHRTFAQLAAGRVQSGACSDQRYVNVVVAVQPPGVVATTGATPTLPGGAWTNMNVSDMLVIVASDAPTVTIVPGANPLPAMANREPPAAGPQHVEGGHR